MGLLWWVYCDGFTVMAVQMAGGRDVGLLWWVYCGGFTVVGLL